MTGGSLRQATTPLSQGAAATAAAAAIASAAAQRSAALTGLLHRKPKLQNEAATTFMRPDSGGGGLSGGADHQGGGEGQQPPPPPQPPQRRVGNGHARAHTESPAPLELAWRVVFEAEQRKAALIEHSRPPANRNRRPREAVSLRDLDRSLPLANVSQGSRAVATGEPSGQSAQAPLRQLTRAGGPPGFPLQVLTVSMPELAPDAEAPTGDLLQTTTAAAMAAISSPPPSAAAPAITTGAPTAGGAIGSTSTGTAPASGPPAREARATQAPAILGPAPGGAGSGGPAAPARRRGQVLGTAVGAAFDHNCGIAVSVQSLTRQPAAPAASAAAVPGPSRQRSPVGQPAVAGGLEEVGAATVNVPQPANWSAAGPDTAASSTSQAMASVEQQLAAARAAAAAGPPPSRQEQRDSAAYSVHAAAAYARWGRPLDFNPTAAASTAPASGSAGDDRLEAAATGSGRPEPQSAGSSPGAGGSAGANAASAAGAAPAASAGSGTPEVSEPPGTAAAAASSSGAGRPPLPPTSSANDSEGSGAADGMRQRSAGSTVVHQVASRKPPRRCATAAAAVRSRATDGEDLDDDDSGSPERIRRSKSMPATRKWLADDALAKPCRVKSPPPPASFGRRQLQHGTPAPSASSSMPKSTAAAAAGAGAVAAKKRSRGSKKLMLPFAYSEDDPRVGHVECAEGRISPEFLPDD